MIKYNRKLKEKARRLRTQMTDPDGSGWGRLRRKQVHSVQFYRQKPIGNYILDFYAPKAKMVVEVDGSQHMESEQATRPISESLEANPPFRKGGGKRIVAPLPSEGSVRGDGPRGRTPPK